MTEKELSDAKTKVAELEAEVNSLKASAAQLSKSSHPRSSKGGASGKKSISRGSSRK